MISSLFASFIATRVGKMLPSWAWELVIIANLVGGCMVVHHVQVVHHDNGVRAAQKASDDAAWKKTLDQAHAEALAFKVKTEQQGATISADERKLHEQAVASNAAAADALRLRGPGAASAGGCRSGDHSPTPAAAGGHEQAAPRSGPAAAQVPSADWAIVPWSWLTKIAQEHDDLRDTVKTIEDNDAKQRANWPSSAPKGSAGTK